MYTGLGKSRFQISARNGFRVIAGIPSFPSRLLFTKAPSTAPCERLVSTHARRPPMTPPGMASRGPPPGPSLLTIARLSRSALGGRRYHGRDYHISRGTRHELQAHHGYVAILNRPRAGSALVSEVDDLMCVKVCLGCDFLHTGAPVAVTPKEFRMATKPRQARRTSTDREPTEYSRPHIRAHACCTFSRTPLTLIHARVCTV